MKHLESIVLLRTAAKDEPTSMTKRRGRHGLLLSPWIGAVSIALAACSSAGEGTTEDVVVADPVAMDGKRLDEYAKLTRVHDAMALSDADLDHVLELRSAYGLSSEAGRVRALYERPAEFVTFRSRKSLFGGLWLEESEIPKALERAEVEFHGGEADIWAQRELGKSYAGSYLEGTRVILPCAGCDEAEVTRAITMEPLMPRVLRGRVVVRQVARSYDELTAMEEKVAAHLRDREIADIGSSIDVVENSVVLFAGPSGAAALEDEIAALEGIADGPLKVVIDDLDIEQDNYKYDALGYALVEAGQSIDPVPATGSTCTSAFTVGGYFGPFILTAAHCTQYVGEMWYQGGYPLGTVAARNDSTSFDAALITTYGYRNNWGRVHDNYWDDAHAITFPVGDNNLMWQTVCQTGKTTTCMDGLCNAATRCGIVTSQTFRRSGWDQPVWGLSNYTRAWGDSGAAVFWPTGYGYGAAGVHSSGGSGIAIFSRMPVIMGAWGLSLTPW